MEISIVVSCLTKAFFILTPMAFIRRISFYRAVSGIAAVGALSGAILSWDWLRHGLAFIPFFVAQMIVILILASISAARFTY